MQLILAANVRFTIIVVQSCNNETMHKEYTKLQWLLFNLPPATRELAEDLHTLPPGTLQGRNDWRRSGYGGPCPPIGSHRYFHKLYALDCVLPDLGRPTKAQLEGAMQGHVLAKAELIGTYRKKRG